MEDLTGKQLGPYKLIKQMGEGGMATVYKAYQASMDRYVALKILPSHFANDPQFSQRFIQEAKVIANLEHPNILPVHDFGKSDNYTYLVMRLIEGGSLSDLMNGSPLPFSEINRVISQIGSALDYAHRHGVIHRDIKPANILIDKLGNCLLTDFGVAKIVEGSSHLTKTGGILGTPAYISPEQGMGQAIDHRTDIYSLGVILYQMVVGILPYNAETPMAVVIKHIHDPLPPPHLRFPTLPEAIEQVILKSLTKSPADRFDSAGTMVAALDKAVSALPNGGLETIANFSAPHTSNTLTQTASMDGATRTMPAMDPQGTIPQQPPAKNKWLLPLGAALLTAFLSLGAVYLYSNKAVPRNAADTIDGPNQESGVVKTTRTSSTSEPENNTPTTPLPKREIVNKDTPQGSPSPGPKVDSPETPAPSEQPIQKISSLRDLPPAPPERLTRPGDGLDLNLMLLFHNNKPTATVTFNGKIIAAEHISWSPKQTPMLQFHFEHQRGKFQLTGDLFRSPPDQTGNNELILIGHIDTEKNIGNLIKRNRFDFTVKLNDPWNVDDVAGEWLGWAVPLNNQAPNKVFTGEASAIKAALRSTMNKAAVVDENPSHGPLIMTIKKIKRAGNLWIARADEKWYLLLASSESPQKVMIGSHQGNSFIGLKPFVPRPEHTGGNFSQEDE